MLLQSVTLGRLRLVTFGVNELKQGLEYVRQRAYFVGGSDGNEAPVLNVTGMGCTVFGKVINETFNVRLVDYNPLAVMCVIVLGKRHLTQSAAVGLCVNAWQEVLTCLRNNISNRHICFYTDPVAVRCLCY